MLAFTINSWINCTLWMGGWQLIQDLERGIKEKSNGKEPNKI